VQTKNEFKSSVNWKKTSNAPLPVVALCVRLNWRKSGSHRQAATASRAAAYKQLGAFQPSLRS
jgi:hypothetical protein